MAEEWEKGASLLSPVITTSPSNLPFDMLDNISMFFTPPGDFPGCNLSLKWLD